MKVLLPASNTRTRDFAKSASGYPVVNPEAPIHEVETGRYDQNEGSEDNYDGVEPVTSTQYEGCASGAEKKGTKTDKHNNE